MSDERGARDGFRRFSFECPRCGLELGEYAERCPECGQNLFEVFSGTFRPRPRVAARIVAVVVLLAFLAAMATGFVLSLRALR